MWKLGNPVSIKAYGKEKGLSLKKTITKESTLRMI
jgi:hypothetical protein